MSSSTLRILSLSAVLLSVPAAFAQANKDQTIAFAGIDAREGATSDQAAHFGDLLTATLVNDGKLRVVERAQIAKVMKEQALASSGVMSDEVQIKVANLVGARYLALGSIAREGRSWTLNLRAIDSSTAQIASADTQKIGGADQLEAAARTMARRLTDKLLGTKTSGAGEVVGDFDPSLIKEASRQLARMLAARFPKVEGKLVNSLPNDTSSCHFPDTRGIFKGERFELSGYDMVTEHDAQKGYFLLTDFTETSCSGRIKKTAPTEISDGDTIRSMALKVAMDPLEVGAGVEPELGKLFSNETKESLKNQPQFDLNGEAQIFLSGRIVGGKGHRAIEVQAQDKSGNVIQRWDLTGAF
ncbi:MAG: hypothetical protein JST92_10695 [Deltaproteobacteria bacterium]|nr:hypothetical protein [Deltaproteobacteria bacterium]